ncbi:MAG: alpha/beta hydrolase [Roseiflexaceae bacterium]
MTAEISNHTLTIDGLTMHYLLAGSGDPLVLLHGFPQHSHMWRRIMPVLAERFTVIAPDLRGAGGSGIPAGGYDKRTMAADLHGLLRRLGLGPVHLAGYDLGGGTAYAYAAGYPGAVRRLAVIEYVPPGFGYEAGLQPTRDWQSWQLAFFTVPDVAVQFIAGKERELLSWYFWHWSYNPDAVSMADFEIYVRQLQKPGALRAGFASFAAVFDDTEYFKELARRKLPFPVLALGGERGAGAYMVPGWQQLAEDVRGGVIERAGHWIAEEQPDILAAQLLAFFGEPGA